jgi:ATP-dependent Clp protease ATP-binding subunit ClpX
VHQLQRDDLVKILTEPKNALVKQFQRFFAYDDIELVFTEEALWEIAEKALAARPAPAACARSSRARCST